MSRALRAIQLLRELPRGQGHQSAARVLAERLGVSERTVYRDLEALQAAGCAVGHDDGGYYVLVTDQTTAPLLTSDEIAALSYTAQWVVAAVPPSIQADVARALDKLAASVGTADAVRDALDQGQGIAVTPPLTDGPPAVVHLLTALRARRLRRVLRATYHSPDDPHPSERLLHPYAVTYRGHAHYLVAFCELRGDERTFRLDRFQSLALTDAPAQIPERYDLERHFSGAWEVTGGRRYRVRLLLEGVTARRLRTCRMHPSQRAMREDGDELELEFHVALTDEFRSWVLGLGPDAKVLGPQSLARAIASAAAEIAASYRAT